MEALHFQPGRKLSPEHSFFLQICPQVFRAVQGSLQLFYEYFPPPFFPGPLTFSILFSSCLLCSKLFQTSPFGYYFYHPPFVRFCSSQPYTPCTSPLLLLTFPPQTSRFTFSHVLPRPVVFLYSRLLLLHCTCTPRPIHYSPKLSSTRPPSVQHAQSRDYIFDSPVPYFSISKPSIFFPLEFSIAV